MVVYAVVVILGMLGSRASIVGMRGGHQTTSLPLSILGAVSTFGTIALLLWGFFRFEWYWPVMLFIAGTVTQAFAITRPTLPFWLSIGPLLDLAVLVGGIYLVWFAS